MTNNFQEALNWVKSELTRNCYSTEQYFRKAHSCIDTLQELVDKETPKKPIYIERDEETDGGDACPNCYSYMGINFESNYCTQCGQRLDWSENE